MIKNEIKKVDFEGAELLAIKDFKTEKIYASVTSICNAISDNDKSFKDNQVQKIQKDNMLKVGCLKFQAGVFDQNNEVFGIELDYLPIWLAKISITTKMINEKPELARKLIEYQLKAKDVLAKVFVHKEEITQEDLLILGIVKSKSPSEQAVAIKDYGEYVKQEENKRLTEEIIEPLKLDLKDTKQDLEHAEDTIMAFATNVSLMEKRQRISQIVKYKTKNYKERYNLLYSEFNKKFHIDVKRRLDNAKERGDIKKSVNIMEYICSEKYLNKTNELYDVAVKIFEGDFIKLLDEWRDSVEN